MDEQVHCDARACEHVLVLMAHLPLQEPISMPFVLMATIGSMFGLKRRIQIEQ